MSNIDVKKRLGVPGLREAIDGNWLNKELHLTIKIVDLEIAHGWLLKWLYTLESFNGCKLLEIDWRDHTKVVEALNALEDYFNEG